MIIDKVVGDIVFLTDKELGISSDSKKSRPCIILEMEGTFDDDICYLVHTTTKEGLANDYNRKQYKLANGSMVKLNQEPHRIRYEIIKYTETPTYDHIDKYYFSNDDWDFLINHFEKYFY